MSSKWDWLEDELSENGAILVRDLIADHAGLYLAIEEVIDRIERHFADGSRLPVAELGVIDYILQLGLAGHGNL